MKVKSCEERAIALLEKLKRPKEEKAPKRPYFIEITGPPSSGKTTIISILDPFFRRQGFRVYTPQEGAEVIRHIPRTSHLYNVRTGLYALTTLIDASVNNNYDLVIFDRCLYDAYVWMEHWYCKSEIKETERNILQEFFLFKTWLEWLDAIFFVTTSVEEAIKRDKAVSLTKKFGSTTNPQSIENLIEVFTDLYYKCRSTHHNVFFLDTTGLTRPKMTKWVLEITLDALEKRFGKENHCIKLNLAKELEAEKFATSKAKKIKRSDKLLPEIRSTSKRLPEIKIIDETTKKGKEKK